MLEQENSFLLAEPVRFRLFLILLPREKDFRSRQFQVPETPSSVVPPFKGNPFEFRIGLRVAAGFRMHPREDRPVERGHVGLPLGAPRLRFCRAQGFHQRG